MKIGMTCFNQMWLPISLEEDLSSFERGEGYFFSFFWINHLQLLFFCQGWLRYLCDRHLHGNVLQHHHRLGCLLLCGEVSQVFQSKSLSNNSLQHIKSLSLHQRMISWVERKSKRITLITLTFSASSQQGSMQRIARSV